MILIHRSNVKVGQQLDAMYNQLRKRDEAVAVRFVDRLKPAKKKALRDYWMKVEDSTSFDRFFNK